MKLDYDAAKNARNIAQRALSFEQVRDFDFERAVFWQDLRKTYPEARHIALGMLNARLHVLCFTPIEGGIRVISFRRANKREMKIYETAHAID